MTTTTAVSRKGAKAQRGPRLTVRPISFRLAAAFVALLHRHNKPPRGCKFCICVRDESGAVRGVAMCGRPVARAFDDGATLEINRTCTDGCENANSCLIGASRRVAAAMGYQRVITYTQADESGASMRAAGFRLVKHLEPRKSWAEHSVKLRNTRDEVGNGGVARVLWEWRAA